MHDQVHACCHETQRHEQTAEPSKLRDASFAAIEIDRNPAAFREHIGHVRKDTSAAYKVRNDAIAEEIDDHQIEAVLTRTKLNQVRQGVRLHHGQARQIEPETLLRDPQNAWVVVHTNDRQWRITRKAALQQAHNRAASQSEH